MNRIEIEINLNRDRAWLLETFAAIPETDLNREITTSRHDPEASWTAKDHLSHLIGIEVAFNTIIKRHIEGNPSPIGIATAPDGTRRSQEQMMTVVHAMNEKWVNEHKSKTLGEVIALGQTIRSETLAILGSLTDAQLAEKIPGAPWGDGTVGEIIAINGNHGRQHYTWVSEALAGKKI